MLRLTVLAIFVLLVTILISLVAILVSLISILVSLVASLVLLAATIAMLGAIAAMLGAIVVMLIPLTAVEIPHAGVGPPSSSNDGSPALAVMTVRGCALARSILVLSGLCHIWHGKLSNSKAQSGENDYLDCYAMFHCVDCDYDFRFVMKMYFSYDTKLCF
jgi:hypothetical protein